MAVLGALVGVRVLTELLDPSAYGELTLGLTIATLVNQTIMGPLGNGITRFYAPAAECNDIDGYLATVFRLVLIATKIVVLLMLLVVIAMLIAGKTKWSIIAIAALIFALLSGYSSILSGIQNAARQRPIVALHQGMDAWARFMVAACLLLWLGATSVVAMMGYALAVSFVLGSQYVFFRKFVPSSVIVIGDERRWQEQIWQYSWPFGAWGFFYWAQYASDRWALEVFSTTEDVGMYSVLFQLGYYPMSMITGMAIQFLAPIFYQRAGDASDSLRNAGVENLSWRLTWLAFGLTGLVFFIALFFHGQIFFILAAAEYASLSYLLPWMLLAGGVFAAGQVIALNLMTLMKTQAIMVAKIITSLIGVSLNFAGAYWYGITGIVMASVLFSCVYFLWMVMLSMKYRKIKVINN